MKNSMWGRLRLDLFGRSAELDMLRNVVEFAPNAIVLIDKSGQIILINAQTETLFGFTRQELQGQPVEQLIPHSFRDNHPNLRNSFFANPSQRAMGAGRDLFGLRKDGTEFPIEIGLNPISSHGDTLALASIIDITERKREAERFRQVIESAPNAMVLVNAQGRITLVNSQTESLFGYSRQELLEKPIEILVPRRFRDAHPGFRDKFFANPSRRAMGSGRDLFGLRKDGSEFPVEIGLNPIPSQDEVLALASIIDITERKRTEDRIRQVIEAVPNAIVQVNRDGVITLVNSQTETLFGYSRDELVGQPVDKLIPDRFRVNHDGFIASYFQNPRTRAMGAGRELYGRRRDGSEFPVEIGLNPITTDEELLVLASIVDITISKQSEDKEDLLMQELHQGVSLLAATSEQIMDSVNQTAISTQQTATSISEIATTVRQVKETALLAGEKAKGVTHSVERTQSVAEDGRLAVEETLQSMSQIRNQMGAIGESILRLSEQTQTVSEVVSMVSDMAEQSNLLGVNASIEAAKAGDLGKGFSVVAQEIKALASQSKKATAQVRVILNDVQKAMTKAVMVAEQGSKAVEIGFQRSQVSGKAIASLNQCLIDSSTMAIEIASTSQQQNLGMDQISEAMENIHQASQDNVRGIQQVEKAVHNLRQMGQQQKQLMEEFNQDGPETDNSASRH